MPATSLAASKIKECNTLYQLAEDNAAQAKHLAERAAHFAVLLGIKLKALKADTAHGEWVPLFNEVKNESGFVFGLRTAQNYMAAAEAVLARKAVTARDKKTITAIALEEKLSINEHGHQLLNKATDGHTLNQLYLDLGITRRTGAQTIEQNRNTKGSPKKKPGGATPAEASKALDLDRADATETFRAAILKIDQALKINQHLDLHPDTAQELIDDLTDHIKQLKNTLKKK